MMINLSGVFISNLQEMQAARNNEAKRDKILILDLYKQFIYILQVINKFVVIK